MTPITVIAALIVAGAVTWWLCSLISRGLTGTYYHVAAWLIARADARVYRMGRSRECRRWADSMTPLPEITVHPEPPAQLPAPTLTPPVGAGLFSRLARWFAQGEV